MIKQAFILVLLQITLFRLILSSDNKELLKPNNSLNVTVKPTIILTYPYRNNALIESSNSYAVSPSNNLNSD